MLTWRNMPSPSGAMPSMGTRRTCRTNAANRSIAVSGRLAQSSRAGTRCCTRSASPRSLPATTGFGPSRVGSVKHQRAQPLGMAARKSLAEKKFRTNRRTDRSVEFRAHPGCRRDRRPPARCRIGPKYRQQPSAIQNGKLREVVFVCVAGQSIGCEWPVPRASTMMTSWRVRNGPARVRKPSREKVLPSPVHLPEKQ